VGPADHLDGLHRWLERCREPIPAKDERYPHLFPSFPGCDIDRSLFTTLVFSDRNTRQVPARPLQALTNRSGANTVTEAVDLYADEIAALAEENRVDLILVARPDQLRDTRARRPVRAGSRRPGPGKGGNRGPGIENFHDLLKARMLHLRQPCRSCGAARGKRRPHCRPAGAVRTRRAAHGTCISRFTTRPAASHGACPDLRPS
jgi:hypothetical protein